VATLEMFYIPERRTISQSLVDVKSLKEELRSFLECISNLKSDTYLRVGPEDVSIERDHEYLWEIPDLLRLIDLCLIQEGEFNNLSDEGKALYEVGNDFFKSLERIYDSWKYWVEFIFPDIEINPPQGTERGRRKTSAFRDKSLGKNISNWKWFGSGTQQLLNMIFLIEFLKFGPSINYKQVQIELDKKNFENAFKYIYPERNCRILFIDEPEVSLHPGLQKKFFKYIYDASKFIQVFIATQSHFFLNLSNFPEGDINLILCQKSESHEKPSPYKIIKKKDLILIYDDMLDYTVKETANFLSMNDYYYLSLKKKDLSYDFNNLDMIKNLLKYVREDAEYKNKICDLGRTIEDPETRMIQNVSFLSVDPQLCELGKKEGKVEKVFFGQYLVNPKKYDDRRTALLELYKRFYRNECLKMNVLCYKKDEIPIIIDRMNRDLVNVKEKILKKRSILIFQENLFPYSLVNFLIKFATENEIVIVSGLEHITLEKFRDFINDLPSNIKKRYLEDKNFSKLVQDRTLKNNNWINQAIIINADKKFSFQIKNVPFHSIDITENIPIIQYPSYSIYNTIVGKIAIFICKDFLVNYPVIDKWMDKHEVNYAIIPSNTYLVNPFTRKFGEIVNFKKNKEKYFFFVNIAEFSGSGMFCHEKRTDYEPGNTTLFSKKQEGILPFEL
ncbi:MAG: AAA family ATPase, partial [Candidatus Odinarchaeota archaeon]